MSAEHVGVKTDARDPFPDEPGVVVRDVPTPESESGWVIEIDSVRVH
jgi:hypothetical protein